jgi:hypothetical protein
MVIIIVTLALDQAEMHGLIQKRPNAKGTLSPTRWPLEVTLPDLKQINQIAVAQSINNIVIGLGQAVEQGIIDIEVAREVVVMFIEQMGIKIDVQAMIERIKMNPPVAPAGSGGNPQNPQGKTVLSPNKPQNLATPNAKPSQLRQSNVERELREILNERDTVAP